MLLLTTPDYLPKIGGLTSHTLNVEKVLKRLGVAYELFNWNSYKDILSFPKERLEKYDHILNIHSGFHMYMPPSSARVINFVCGAEILFYSPNRLKHLVKQLTRRKAIRRVEEAHVNLFISDFTFQTLIAKGLTPSYSRDLTFHMCVDLAGHQLVKKDWNGPLKFVCVARDVPHKNFAGTIALCERTQEILGRPVELVTVTNREFTSEKIKITSYLNPTNEVRDQLLRDSHLNILLSLDHSKKGFFEGFGQIVQEAGAFGTPSLVLGTGGLPESVHHGVTGWVLPDLRDESVRNWLSGMTPEVYDKISTECYRHTVESHGLDSWERLFQKLLLP
jgi:glycosyltransferase involved in cell wall biosynthesis